MLNSSPDPLSSGPGLAIPIGADPPGLNRAPSTPVQDMPRAVPSIARAQTRPFEYMRQLSVKILGGADVKIDEPRATQVQVQAAPDSSSIICMVCCEEFGGEMAHYTCDNNPQTHCLCVTCFADYVNHCCESWATLNTIPITCQIPNCGYQIPETRLQKLLNDPIIEPRKLWEKYNQVQLKLALAKADEKSPEVPVTCAFCGNYSEFYVKASPDYWQNAERERFKVKIEKEQALYEATQRMKHEAEKKLLDQIMPDERVLSEEEKILVVSVPALRHMLTLVESGQTKVNQLIQSLGEHGRWDLTSSVPLPDGFEFNEERFTALMAFDHRANQDRESWISTKRELERQMTALRDKLNQTLANAEALTKVIEKQREAYKSQINAEFESKRKDLLVHLAEEVEEKLHSEIRALEESVETSQYFVCRNLFCDGAYCLKCETFLKKSEMSTHYCSADPVDKLYERLLQTLAIGASRTCPSCGVSGMKDLACTHITCDKCKNKFCYVCGVAESKLQGGFSAHNQWDRNNPQDTEHCPMYLHYKWGSDGRNAAAALDSFHRELQIKAVETFKKEVNDDALWNQMVEKKYGDKPIVAPPVYYDGGNSHAVADVNLLAGLNHFELDHDFAARLERRRAIMDPLENATLIYGVIYILFFLGIYCWMIHEGQSILGSNSSHQDLGKFAIVQGSLGWVLMLFLILWVGIQAAFGRYSTCGECSRGCILFWGGLTCVSMFGTFIWGAVLFYKSSPFGMLWTCMSIYFNGVWISSGVACLFYTAFLVVEKWFGF
eukprot:TRINITY_DN4380_c0_g1_i6.p1 TRINITY_DN4380_c0_g1~~TRINITY_DN4380_c0_g1_i6.p1  ORF type:complete len:780 (+),score=166.81 TRINITY_DN4380_c0_g1_i6:16-2355(+)